MKLREFLDFVREQGIVGLAVGFVLGGVTKDVVTSFVDNIVNPLVGLLLPRAESLAQKSWNIGSAQVRWGDFILALLDFTIMCAIVFMAIHVMRVNKLDKKGEVDF